MRQWGKEAMTGKAMRRLGTALVIAIAALAIVSTQGRWEPPYKKGVDAVRAGKWQDAINNLEAAIKIDSKQEANKLAEGTFRTDYFPYYYLAVAHLKLGHLDKAEENLQRATKENIGKLAPLIKAAEADIAAAKPKPQPTEPVAPPPSPPTRPAETRPSEP